MHSSESTFAPPLSVPPSIRRGLLWSAIGIAVYAAVVLSIPTTLGATGTAAMLALPLGLLAWQFGMRVGAAVAVTGVPMAYFLSLGHAPAEPAGQLAAGIAHVAVVALAIVVGRLRDLGLRANRELIEHARAQRLLRQKQTQSDALLSALPDTIIRLGDSGELRGASGGRGSYGGLLRRIEDLVTPRAADLIRTRAARVMATQQPEELEYDIAQGDRVSDYEARFVACGSDEVIGILRDVTQRKRLERELIGAREAALEAARIKTKFLANMSHEIRTPMNGVIGMTNLLRETNLSREQAEYVEIIYKSGQALLEIIDDILDFAKIEAGKMELDEVAFDLRAGVYESVEALANQAFAKDLELATIFDPGIPRRALGDPTRLRQVLANLLSNAVKFTDRGQVLVRVEQVSRRPGQQMLRFSVSDTGLGLSDAIREKLFQPMLLGEKEGEESESRRGTGLGLAICHELVQLMGGEIGAESSMGQGTCFWFTARLGTVDDASSDDAVPPPNPRGVPVLLVHTATRRLLAEQLQGFGVIPSAADHSQAVDRLLAAEQSGQPFAAVMVDMPRDPKTALSCIEAIRAEASLKDLPVMAVDAPEPPPSTVREELRRVVGRMLAWPVRHDELYGALTAALGRAHEEPLRRTLSTELPAASQGLALGMRVLVAEDNLVNQRVAQRTLQLLGCESAVAENGQEAVERALSGDYDVVLMDCQMPVMDGFEATREIRRRQGDQYIPVIAMTASNVKGERDRCIQAHMDDFLCKPVTLPDLRAVLDRWKQGPKAQRSQAEQGGPQSEMDVPVGDAIEREVIRKLLEIGDGDPEFVAEMIDLFLDQTPRHLEAMRTSLSVGDLAAVGKAAHTTKSSAAYLGALRMAELCKVVEAKARSGDATAVTRGVEALHAEFERARKALSVERGLLET